MSEFVIYVLLLGIGATACMDLWSLFLKYSFDIHGLDYRLLGRWIGHLPKGTFSHPSIMQAPIIAKESLIGWSAHYAIGITFAGFLIAAWGIDWIKNPTLFPALFVGVITIVAPFLILQPAFGLGIAGANTPSPNILRLKSFMTHTSFGLGLYVVGLLLKRMGIV